MRVLSDLMRQRGEALRCELLLVRVRVHGRYARTHWLVADAEAHRSFGPRVGEREAIARFEAETGRTHETIAIVREHHLFADAAALVRRTFATGSQSSPAAALSTNSSASRM